MPPACASARRSVSSSRARSSTPRRRARSSTNHASIRRSCSSRRSKCSGNTRERHRVPGTPFLSVTRYSLRVIAENLFGRDAVLPPLQLSYRLESRIPGALGGAEAVQGRDFMYAMPALPVRILSLVPDHATEIQEPGRVDLRADRGSLLSRDAATRPRDRALRARRDYHRRRAGGVRPPASRCDPRRAWADRRRGPAGRSERAGRDSAGQPRRRLDAAARRPRSRRAADLRLVCSRTPGESEDGRARWLVDGRSDCPGSNTWLCVTYWFQLVLATIVWLSSELMFFAALFAIYFTARAPHRGRMAAGADRAQRAVRAGRHPRSWSARRSPVSTGCSRRSGATSFGLRR